MMKNMKNIKVVFAEFWQAVKVGDCRNFFVLFMFSQCLSINFDDILQLWFCNTSWIAEKLLSESTQSSDNIDTLRNVIFIIWWWFFVFQTLKSFYTLWHIYNSLLNTNFKTFVLSSRSKVSFRFIRLTKLIWQYFDTQTFFEMMSIEVHQYIQTTTSKTFYWSFCIFMYYFYIMYFLTIFSDLVNRFFWIRYL